MIISLTFLPSNKSDTMGHVGGIIVGFLYGLAFFPRIDRGIGPKLKKPAIVIFILFFILIPILFWTIEKWINIGDGL